jgi:hypothetical protein
MKLKTGGILATAVVVAALAGCGGGGGGGGSPTVSGVAPPEVHQRSTDAAQLLSQAIDAGSCRKFTPLVLTTARAPGLRPGAPATASECGSSGTARVRKLGGFKLANTDTFGTAALAEGSIPPIAGRTTGDLVLILDSDGTYRYAAAVAAGSQIGKPPIHDAAFDSAASAFIEALRAGNCAQLYRYSTPTGSLLGSFNGSKSALCKALLHPGTLRPKLRADPTLQPVRLGSTPNFAFYGLSTRKAYYTMFLYWKPAPGHSSASMYDYYLNIQPQR